MKGVSVAVPLYNEEDNVKPLYLELTQVLEAMDCDYELIFVDDGSRDFDCPKHVRGCGRGSSG